MKTSKEDKEKALALYIEALEEVIKCQKHLSRAQDLELAAIALLYGDDDLIDFRENLKDIAAKQRIILSSLGELK